MDENRIAGAARSFGRRRRVVSSAMRRRRFEEWPTKPPAPRRNIYGQAHTAATPLAAPPVTLPRRSKSGCAGRSRPSPTPPLWSPSASAGCSAVCIGLEIFGRRRTHRVGRIGEAYCANSKHIQLAGYGGACHRAGTSGLSRFWLTALCAQTGNRFAKASCGRRRLFVR